MADPLSLHEVVDTLVEMDLVDLDSDGPWPGDPDDADAYEPDWTQIHPKDSDLGASLDRAPGRPNAYDEIQQRASSGFLVPPPDVLDALAWYTPIHYFGLGSAIYIRETAVFDVAAAIVNRLPEPEREVHANLAGASRAAMSVLYLHEAYHHKIESLAIRLEMVERARRYLPYSKECTSRSFSKDLTTCSKRPLRAPRCIAGSRRRILSDEAFPSWCVKRR